MPKTSKTGKAKKSELPSTLQRSGRKAQQTFAETYDSAIEQYGDERRAHQVAFASLKHTHEKVGDHWEPKAEYGPSDERAAEGGPDATKETAGGVDAFASKKHLYELATRLSQTSSQAVGHLAVAHLVVDGGVPVCGRVAQHPDQTPRLRQRLPGGGADRFQRLPPSVGRERWACPPAYEAPSACTTITDRL